MRILWRNLQNNRRSFVLALCVGLLYTAVCVVVPTVSGRMINGFIESTDIGTKFLLLYLFFSALQILFFLFDQKASKDFEIRQKQHMRGHVFEAISREDSLSKEQLAFYTSFLNNDIPTVSSQYFLGTVDIVKCGAMICFSAFSLMRVHFVLGFLVLLLSIAIVLVPRMVRDKSGDARRAYSDAMAAYHAQLQSYLGGLKIIGFFRYGPRANGFLETRNSAVADSEMVLCKHQRFVQGVTAFLQTAKTVLILTVGVLLIARKEISIGDLVVVLELDEVIGAPIEVLSYMIHGKNEALPLVKRYEEIVIPETTAPDQTEMESVEELVLEDISFRTESLEILHGITARFEKSGKYILTGPSGSGKSTLLYLLARMAVPTSGHILVNGRDVETVSKAAYRDKVCMVFQEPYLFEATLEENILLGRDIPRARYLEILERLRLSYLLERYKDCTVTPELADTLSGGEKQRVCLARAMVGEPEVYLLDEITSALDRDTAQAIESAILQENAMVIHVCHKPTPELYSRYDAHFQIIQGTLTQD